jgi:2-methylcitrate dehydratase PrpD
VPDPLSNLCRFVSGASLSSIPDPVIQQAKRILLDTLGVITAGSVSKEIHGVALDMPGCPSPKMSATCPGRPGGFDPLNAAMLNGMAGSTLEFEEGNALAMGHPGIQIVPAIIAAAESAGLSGARLVAGIVCGYEVACRVSRACSLRTGLHPTGTWGVIGSALGVGSLRKRTPDQLVQIANIAASYTISSYVKNAFAGRNVSCTFAGMVNHAGLIANIFFESGIQAETDSLEMTFSRFASGHFDAKRLAADLGHTYAVSGNYFKPYPTCRYTQPALDALRLLLEKSPVTPDQIDEIVVFSFKAAVQLHSDPPRNLEAMRFSVPYLLGVMLTRGRVDMDTLNKDLFDDPQVAAVAGKVKLVLDPEYERLRPGNNPALIRLRLKNGQEISQEVMNCRGDPIDPMSENEISDKFLSLAGPVVGKDKAFKILDAIHRIEKEPDVRPVMAMFRSRKLKTPKVI